LNEQWKRIRRGWYLGGDEFQSRLLQRVKRTVSQGLAASYSGAAKRAHGEREAARMLAQGKAALGWRAEDLARAPKNLLEKQVLAWWLRQRTTVSRRWISQRLGMGEESGVTRAVRKVKTVQDAKLKRTQQQLLNGVAEWFFVRLAAARW
jgi:hypothetical protein